jgi:hypothetical protein
MNLAEIRDMVGSILDYSPDVQTYKDEVTRVVNQLYLEMFADHKWQFAQKTRNLTARGDVTTTGTASSGVLTVGDSDTAVIYSKNTWMEGQIVEVSGGTWSSGKLSGEYRIVKIELATLSTSRLYLEDSDGNSVTSGATSAAATVRIKNRYIDMPEDMVKVLSLGIRSPASSSDTATGNATIHFLNCSRHLDEELDLDLDIAGRPTDWIRYDNYRMPQPVTAPVLESTTGSLAAGTYYVKYTFEDSNRKSASSSAASITLASTAGINITSGLQSTGANSGTVKRVYIRTPDSMAYYQSSNSVVTETTTTLSALAIDSAYFTSADRIPEHGGSYERVRLYPRQDSDITVTVRYLFQPPMLAEDTDVPLLPPSHHNYLVYRACQELFVKHENDQHSELYRRKADAELLRMENRYLSEGATHWVKASFRSRPSLQFSESKLTTSG